MTCQVYVDPTAHTCLLCSSLLTLRMDSALIGIHVDEGSMEQLPQDLEPSEIKSAKLEGHPCSMHEQGLNQWRGKGAEI